MEILHTGQTGVERGAHRAARALGIPVAGVCEARMRDEWGPLPDDVAIGLAPAGSGGARTALRATLRLASGLIVLVPSRADYAREAGMASLAREARILGVPCEVADRSASVEAIVASLPAAALERLMITGPRGTRWPDGDRMAWQFVTGLITVHFPEREVIPVSAARGGSTET